MKKSLLIILPMILITWMGCEDEHSPDGTDNHTYTDAADCTNSAPTFTGDIQAIMDASCATAGCHDAATATHGIQLDTYDNVVSAVNNHAFLCSIHHGENCSHMPFGQDQLPTEHVEAITCWVKNGMPQ